MRQSSRFLEGGTLAMMAFRHLLASAVAVGLAASSPWLLKTSSGAAPAGDAIVEADALKRFKATMFFEPNLGQSGEGIDFLSRGDGYSLFLSSNEAVLRLSQGGELLASKGKRFPRPCCGCRWSTPKQARRPPASNVSPVQAIT
jgi:hypothetical protein